MFPVFIYTPASEAKIGSFVRAHLGNLHFGGTVRMIVTGREVEYTIETPGGTLISTSTLD